MAQATADRFLRKNPNPIPLDSLEQPDYDVREYRTDHDIENIARSMDEEGQVMPVLLGEKSGGVYPILDGNHRYLAAKELGWPDLDCIETGAGVDDDKAQIISNITRLELSQAEKLAAFDYLLNVLGLNQSEAAREVGFDRAAVHRYAHILKGYGEIKEYFISGQIGVTAAYELNKVEDRDRALNIAKTAVNEGYRDKDIEHQAKWARSDADGENKMKGAGGETQTQNMKQVKRNAEELKEMQGIDQAGVQQAQVAPGNDTGQPPGDDEETAQEPAGPPCMGCGQATDPGPVLHCEFHPDLANELGIKDVDFGACCVGDFIQWWQSRQDEAGAPTDDDA